MREERLEAVMARKEAKEVEKKKKAEADKAAKEAPAVIQKKDKHIAVEEPQAHQQPPKTFTVNNSEDFNTTMDHIISMANAAKTFVRVIGDVESQKLALELDLSQKNKLIADGKTELLRLQSAVTDLEDARTVSADVIKNLRASEAKLKTELEDARKEIENVRETAKKEKAEMAAEFDAEREELEEDVAGGVEDGYARCLGHIRATVPDLDLSEFAWNSVVVDGKVKRKESAPSS